MDSTADTNKKQKTSSLLLPHIPRESQLALEQLLYPISIDTFVSEYWEKKPLLIKNSSSKASFLSSLFNKEQLDTLFQRSDISFGSIHDLCVCNLVNGRKETLFPPSENCNEDLEEELEQEFNLEKDASHLTLKQLDNYFYDQKCTLQIHQPQRFMQDAPLPPLLSGLEDFFHALVGSNAYLTPSHSQGLAPHYDDVEVFVVQQEGCKYWRLWEPLEGMELPDHCSNDLDQEELGTPLLEVCLQPGDVLYFPRGTVHEACTEEEISTHLTISTYQKQSWGALVGSALEMGLEKAMGEDVEMRRGVSLGFPAYMGVQFDVQGGEDDKAKAKESYKSVLRREFRKRFRESVDRLLGMLDVDEVVDEFLYDFVCSRLSPIPPRAVPLNALTGESSVRLLKPCYYRFRVIGADEAEEEEEDQQDDGEDRMCFTTCFDNRQQQHMFDYSGGKGGEEGQGEREVTYSMRYMPMITQLIESEDKSVRIEDLSGDTLELVFVCQHMLENGLLEVDMV